LMAANWMPLWFVFPPFCRTMAIFTERK
jgi:hypothetical protein